MAVRQMAVVTAAVLAVAALVGCGSNQPTTSNDPAAEAPTASASAPNEEAGFPRTVEHAMGETKIPAKPKRVVALDASMVDDALLLGTPVVGFTSYRAIGDTLPDYLGDARDTLAKGAQSVGTLEEPSLEKIIALQPDLILSAKVRHEKLYDKLSAIAPTVFSETTGPTWKKNIELIGTALGEETKATDELARYEKRAKAIGDAINAKASNPTISVVRFVDGPTRLYQKASFSGIVLQDAGLARPAAQDVEDFALEISAEETLKADADDIFVTTYADEAGVSAKTKGQIQGGALWKKLKGRVHEVQDTLWMTPCSIQGAEYILDDLAKAFEVDPQRG